MLVLMEVFGLVMSLFLLLSVRVLEKLSYTLGPCGSGRTVICTSQLLLVISLDRTLKK